MARSIEQLNNDLAGFRLYGTGILHPDLVEELFATAIAAATSAEAAVVEVIPVVRKPRSKQVE